MSSKHLKQLFYLLISVFLTLGLSLSLQSLLAAWTAPTSAPPSGNVSAPLNSGTTNDQVMLGGLVVGGNLAVDTGKNICIAGGNCLASAITSEVDPQVNTLTNGKWCTSDGSAINCTVDAPAGGGWTDNGTNVSLTTLTDKVGIGTDAPNAQLHLYKTSGANAELDIQSVSEANKHWAIYHDRATDDLRFWNNTPAGEKNILTITNEGNVGIGTASPSTALEVAGQVKITGGTPGANKVLTSDAAGLATWQTPTTGIGGSGTANYVPKFTAATTLGNSLIYDNGTNVGIGTANPLYKVHALGTIFASNSTNNSGIFMRPDVGGYGLIQATNESVTALTNLVLQQFGGNVGIGTNAPNSQLHLYKTSGNNAELDIQSVGGANKHWAIYHDRSSDDLRFWNNTPSGEKNILTITNEGNVGIGTAEPLTSLDIFRDIAVSNTIGQKENRLVLRFNSSGIAGAGPEILWMGGNTDIGTSRLAAIGFSVQAQSAPGEYSGDIYFATKPTPKTTTLTERMLITQAGNIGIGTTNPTARLHIGGISGIDGIKFPDGTVQTTAASGGPAPWTASGANINNTNSGNVGIGTANPAALLHILKYRAPTIKIEDTEAGKARAWDIRVMDNLFQINDITASQARITISDNGNVGLGTTVPNELMHISGANVNKIGLKVENTGDWMSGQAGGIVSIILQRDTQYSEANKEMGNILFNTGNGNIAKISALHYGALKNAGQLAFYTAASGNDLTERVRIDSTGNVGIGTTWPGAKLHVVGNIYKTGTVSFVQDHPTDPTKEIVYVSLEGGEAGTYVRGEAQLINGEVEIKLPEHFSLVTASSGLTAQVTPIDECQGLRIVKLTNNSLIVKELNGGRSHGKFYYLINGLRQGYEEYNPLKLKLKK